MNKIKIYAVLFFGFVAPIFSVDYVVRVRGEDGYEGIISSEGVEFSVSSPKNEWFISGDMVSAFFRLSEYSDEEDTLSISILRGDRLVRSIESQGDMVRLTVSANDKVTDNVFGFRFGMSHKEITDSLAAPFWIDRETDSNMHKIEGKNNYEVIYVTEMFGELVRIGATFLDDKLSVVFLVGFTDKEKIMKHLQQYYKKDKSGDFWRDGNIRLHLKEIKPKDNSLTKYNIFFAVEPIEEIKKKL